MLSLNPNFRDLLQLLNAEGVRYLVVGGYAVNFHGHHRNTKDLDVWIAVDLQNAERVSRALQRFGFSASSVPPSNFLQKGKIFVFGREPLRVDILTDPSGVDFGDCYPRRVEAELDGIIVPFISLADLRANMGAAHRTRDKADLEELPRPDDISGRSA